MQQKINTVLVVERLTPESWDLKVVGSNPLAGTFESISHFSSKHTKESATLGGSKRHVYKKYKKRVISLCLEHPEYEIKDHGPNKSHHQNSKTYRVLNGGGILNVIFALTTVIQYVTEIF